MTETAYLARPWGGMAYTHERGPDPTLVLIHGSWCDAEDWNPVKPFLPSGLGILTFDLRGHGKSGGPGGPVRFDDLVDDIIALLDHLGLTAPVLIGHSLGGMLGMRFAERYPERTCGIALLEGWTQLGVPWEARGEMYGMLPAAVIERIANKKERARSRWPDDVLSAFWPTVKRVDALPFLERTRLPVLEIYGDRGKPRPTREQLLIPNRENVELVWLERAGHYLPHEAPRRVGEAIGAWLARAGTDLTTA